MMLLCWCHDGAMTVCVIYLLAVLYMAGWVARRFALGSAGGTGRNNKFGGRLSLSGVVRVRTQFERKWGTYADKRSREHV